MKKYKCKSLFRGNASIGSHQLQEAKDDKEDIQITHDGRVMTITQDSFYKFFTMGNREYRHTDGRPGYYTLQYIRWRPDEPNNTRTNTKQKEQQEDSNNKREIQNNLFTEI